MSKIDRLHVNSSCKTDYKVNEIVENEIKEVNIGDGINTRNALNNEFEKQDFYGFDDANNYSTNFVDELNTTGLRRLTKQEANSLRRVLKRDGTGLFIYSVLLNLRKNPILFLSDSLR